MSCYTLQNPQAPITPFKKKRSPFSLITVKLKSTQNQLLGPTNPPPQQNKCFPEHLRGPCCGHATVLPDRKMPIMQKSIHLPPLYLPRGGSWGSCSRTMQHWPAHSSEEQGEEGGGALVVVVAAGGGDSSSVAWQVILRPPFQPSDLLSCVAGARRAYKLAVRPGLVSAAHSSGAGRWGDVWLATADL